jgi:hypothetical protein
MVAKVFEHPFDLCKVRLQSQVLDEHARFKGPVDCLYKTWKYEGVRGLYRVIISYIPGQYWTVLKGLMLCVALIGSPPSYSRSGGRKRDIILGLQ